MPLKLSPRDTIIAIVALAAAIIVAVLFLGFRPKLTELSQVRAAQSMEEQKLEKNKNKLNQLDAIRSEAADIEAQRIALAQRMPLDAQIPSLIVDIQRLANEADLDLQSITIDDPSEQQGYSEIGMNFEAESSFYTVIDFLYRLEKMKREIVVDSLSIKTSTYPLLKTSIRAKTFVILSKPNQTGQISGGQAAGQTLSGNSAAAQ